MDTSIINLTDGNTIEARYVSIGQKNLSYTLADGSKGTLDFHEYTSVVDSRFVGMSTDEKGCILHLSNDSMITAHGLEFRDNHVYFKDAQGVEYTIASDEIESIRPHRGIDFNHGFDV